MWNCALLGCKNMVQILKKELKFQIAITFQKMMAACTDKAGRHKSSHLKHYAQSTVFSVFIQYNTRYSYTLPILSKKCLFSKKTFSDRQSNFYNSQVYRSFSTVVTYHHNSSHLLDWTVKRSSHDNICSFSGFVWQHSVLIDQLTITNTSSYLHDNQKLI